MNATLITPATLKPISLEELKLHLRIELDVLDEDEYLEALMVAATEYIEDITRRKLLTQTWDYFLDEWPDEDFITLPFGNLQSVPLTQYVKYTDSAGTLNTLAVTTDYIWETNGEDFGRVVLPYADTWPTASLYPSNPIVVRFVCGWTTAALVPFKIKAALKMICAQMYEDRGENIVGVLVTSFSENKMIDRLLASMRLWGNF